MKNLYIDVGSTNIKWRAGEGEAKSILFPAPICCEDPYFEVEAEKIAGIIEKIIRTEGPGRVFFSVQMHGYLLLKDGKPVTNYISWRDKRGVGTTPDFSLNEEYGTRIKPNLPRLSLQLQEVDFDEFCTLGSYLVRRFSGNNITHITDAASTGFYNVKKHEADICGFTLPRAEYSVKEAGRYEESAIYTPVGDQQAAVLGACGGVENFDGYVLNLGTAAQICLVSDSFISGDFESRPYFGGKILCTVTGLPGGAAISAYCDKEPEDRLYEEYFSAIGKLPERKEILVTGGVVKHRRKLLERVLKRLGMEYRINAAFDALDGLKILSEEV